MLFPAWEPPTLALFPGGYVAASGIFGELLDKSQVVADRRLNGLRFLSENLERFTLSALYEDGYHASAYPGEPGKPATAAVVDPKQVTEAWLYDRCATFMLAYAHTGDVRFLRHGSRACSFYASTIDERGFFTLKTDRKGQAMDPKHSHVRGLYFYYALTGDETALEAGRRIANMWLNDASFVRPYREGHARGPENLWTERLLAHSLEALVYGYLLTGQADLLTGARELVESAWGHLTASDPERLRAITWYALAPQDCLVHAAVQHEGEPRGEPFCSPWMSALLVDPLLRYQALTGDRRVDEIFVRLGRYLRDTATRYFVGKPLQDFFLGSLDHRGSRWLLILGRLRPLGEDPTPFYYVPFRQDYESEATFHVRAAGDPRPLVAALRREVQLLDPSLPVFDVKTMTDHLGLSLLPARVAGGALGLFGLQTGSDPNPTLPAPARAASPAPVAPSLSPRFGEANSSCVATFARGSCLPQAGSLRLARAPRRRPVPDQCRIESPMVRP